MTESLISRPMPTGAVGQYLDGLLTPLHGFRFMRRHPSLWRYAVWPIVLNLVIMAMVIVLSLSAATWLLTWVPEWIASAAGNHGSVPGFGIKVLAFAFVIAICIGAALIAWLILTGVFCGQLYGRLAEHVEDLLGLSETDQLTMWQEIKDTTLNAMLLSCGNMLIFALHVIPVVGSVLALVLGWAFTCFVLGVDFLSWPLALRGVRRRGQFQFAQRHRLSVIGFGTSIFLGGLIPFVGRPADHCGDWRRPATPPNGEPGRVDERLRRKRQSPATRLEAGSSGHLMGTLPD